MSDSEYTLTQEALRSLLHYDSATGEFTWVRKSHSKAKAKPGDIAGGLCCYGYVRIKIGKKSYKAHRLAWLYTYGEWPTEFIDHINGDRSDNRISNIRCASNAQNQQNRKAGTNSSHGLLGVTWNNQANRWAARIMLNGKRKHIGYYGSAEEASHAYQEEKRKLHQYAV